MTPDAERMRASFTNTISYAYQAVWEGSSSCEFYDYFQPDPLYQGSIESQFHYGSYKALDKCMISAISGENDDDRVYVKFTDGEKNKKEDNFHYIIEATLYSDKRCTEPLSSNNLTSFADHDNPKVASKTKFPETCAGAEDYLGDYMNDTNVMLESSSFGETRTLHDAVNDMNGVTYSVYPSRVQCRNYLENSKLTSPPNAVYVLETLTVPPCVDIYNADYSDIVASVWTTCGEILLLSSFSLTSSGID